MVLVCWVSVGLLFVTKQGEGGGINANSRPVPAFNGGVFEYLMWAMFIVHTRNGSLCVCLQTQFNVIALSTYVTYITRGLGRTVGTQWIQCGGWYHSERHFSFSCHTLIWQCQYIEKRVLWCWQTIRSLPLPHQFPSVCVPALCCNTRAWREKYTSRAGTFYVGTCWQTRWKCCGRTLYIDVKKINSLQFPFT